MRAHDFASRRKRTRGFISLIFALFATCTVGAGLLCSDERPPDVRNLMPVRVAIPENENAFTYYQRASKFKLFDPYDPKKPEIRWYDMTYGTVPWDDALADELLEKNAAVLENVSKALMCKAMRAPADDLGCSARGVPGNLRGAARLMILRAHKLAREGKHKEALDEVRALVKAGKQIEGSGLGQIGLIVGAAFKMIAANALLHLPGLGDEKAFKHGDVIRILDSASLDRKAHELAIRTEFEYIDRALGLAPKVGAYPLYGGPFIPVTCYSFKLNESRRKLAEGFRVCLANLGRKYADLVQPKVPDMSAFDPPSFTEMFGDKPVPKRSRVNNARAFARRNLIGQLIYASSVLSVRGAQRHGFEFCADMAGMKTLVALRYYKQKTGALPRALDALVPEFFEHVPLDPYNDQPLHYLPDKLVIYSVGPNMSDDGGDAKKDKCFKIDF